MKVCLINANPELRSGLQSNWRRPKERLISQEAQSKSTKRYANLREKREAKFPGGNRFVNQWLHLTCGCWLTPIFEPTLAFVLDG